LKNEISNNTNKDIPIFAVRQAIGGDLGGGIADRVDLLEVLPDKRVLSFYPVNKYTDSIEVKEIMSNDNIVFSFDGKKDTLKTGFERKTIRYYEFNNIMGLFNITDEITIKNHGRIRYDHILSIN
jgi:hypothetical protein